VHRENSILCDFMDLRVIFDSIGSDAITQQNPQDSIVRTQKKLQRKKYLNDGKEMQSVGCQGIGSQR